MLYGCGEVAFQNFYQRAWLHDPAYLKSSWQVESDKRGLPYLGSGDNLIPTIHVQDLACFVKKVAENLTNCAATCPPTPHHATPSCPRCPRQRRQLTYSDHACSTHNTNSANANASLRRRPRHHSPRHRQDHA